ncbi:protein-tyrosine sulfotransferase-like [Silene latifolia]|uniref:protein-tyrosine sulfotransferase-like n=1 Tax=Silene latifolia TaxID=37657 RepID=UPI003D770C70
MDSTPFLFLLLILFFTASAFLPVNASSEDDFQLCESVVNKWATSQLNHEFKEDRHTLRDLLFFLHIPRTGGRIYFRCFLKKLYSNQLCPPSYDKLWFNPRKANCRLLVTHDDYSIMSKLPKEKTSVVTILRNPVDRVFSTYETSIEEAARFLVHSNLTSITQSARRLQNNSNVVSTEDIWPWKYLVPWMREDLFARRDARRLKKQNHVGHNDSYEMGDMTMPLRQYINDPIALDIVHNGETFQVDLSLLRFAS